MGILHWQIFLLTDIIEGKKKKKKRGGVPENRHGDAGFLEFVDDHKPNELQENGNFQFLRVCLQAT